MIKFNNLTPSMGGVHRITNSAFWSFN